MVGNNLTMKKEIEIILGYSKSAWKSLAVKSLRLGWPNGLRAAQTALGKSEVRVALACGVFEDVFPAEAELMAVLQEVKTYDYEALCRRATHHSRGLTARFCELEPRAVDAAENRRSEIWAEGKKRGLWLPLRSLNCFWTWAEMKPYDAGQKRDIDPTPWTGMPLVMLDAHTAEGKQLKQGVTLLSGHYHQHLKLSKLVEERGWGYVRQQVHQKTARPILAAQPQLF